jgi:hypothetical protein
MIVKKLTFPILLFQSNKGPIIYRKNEDEAFSFSKGGEKHFRTFCIIDSVGNIYNISNVIVSGKAPWHMSIRWLQVMNKVEFHGDFIEILSLQQVKDKLIDHIEGKMGYWRALDDFDSLKKEINDKESLKELFSFFK